MANVEYGENAVDYTIVMTNANAEYPLALPDGVKAIEIQSRDAVDVRMSFATGKVATPTESYRTIKSGALYTKELLYLNVTTLYLACASGGKTVEVRAWF